MTEQEKQYVQKLKLRIKFWSEIVKKAKFKRKTWKPMDQAVSKAYSTYVNSLHTTVDLLNGKLMLHRNPPPDPKHVQQELEKIRQHRQNQNEGI